jgi:hypothetical protein
MTYTNLIEPRKQFFDNNGNPLAGGKIYTYVTGTSTPKATYVSPSGAANTNPIILDSAGRADIWLDGVYRFDIFNSASVRLTGYPKDGISTFGDTADASSLLVTATGSTTSRTLANRFADVGNVLDYGAVGNNIANDLTAINNCLAAYPNGQIQLLDKTYRVSAMPNFNGHTLLGNATIIIDDIQQTLTAATYFRDMGNVTIRGKNAYDTTITSVSSVSGSTGNWSVVYNVASTANISVGDIVGITNIVPGIKQPGLLSGRPPAGQLDLAYFRTNSALLTTLGTTATISNGTTVDASSLAVGDFIIAMGQVRQITTAPVMVTASQYTFGLDTAFKGDISSGVQYWYNMRDSSIGTVTVAGTTVTGVGTTFLSNFDVGDLIAIEKSGIREVASITDNTHLEITKTLTVGSASSYGWIKSGEAHHGAWVVTAVGASTITVTNTMRTANMKPPSIGITGGDVKIFKTVLYYNSTTDGLRITDGQGTMYNIALRGNSSTTTKAIDLSYNNGGATLRLNSRFATNGFGYAAYLLKGGSLDATNCLFSNIGYWGVWINDGAFADLASAEITGVNGYGVLVGVGSSSRLADCRVIGCLQQAYRTEVGASVWGDFSYAIGNDGGGAYNTGGLDVHYVGTRFIKNGATGLTAVNGMDGRATGAIFLCNNGLGMSLTGASVEANQTNIIGNGSGGITLVSCLGAILQENGIGFNIGRGLRNYGSEIASDNSQIIGNTSYGWSVQDSGKINGNLVVSLDNLTDFFVQPNTKSSIVIPNYTGSPTFSPALNYVNMADGSAITDGTITVTTKVLTATVTANVGNIAANTTATQTITVAGATVDSDNFVVVGTSASNPAGLILTGAVTAANTVTISLSNVSAGAIDPASQTYRVVVYKLA